MKAKATIASGYRWRLIIIALGCLFWAGWCVKDATVKYPQEIERREYFEAYKDSNPDWATTWPDEAARQGWPIEEPRERSQGDIMTQWAMFVLTAPIGLYCLVLVVLWQGRFIAVDEEAIYSHGSRKATWDQITRIDVSRWTSKGIARVYYNAGAGEQLILLDDWKYERHPTTDIYKTLEANVDAAKFEGADDTLDDTEEPAEAQNDAVVGDPSEQDAIKTPAQS